MSPCSVKGASLGKKMVFTHQSSARYSHRKAGFTVLESLVAIAISISVGLVISQSLADGWKAQVAHEAYGELQRAARFSLDEMTKQIWGASSVISATTINSTTYTSDSDTLVLRLPPIDSGGTIVTGDDYIVFEKDNAALLRLMSAHGTSVRANYYSPLTVHSEVGALAIQYYNAAGAELLPGTHNLTAARRIKLTLTSRRIVNDRTITRSFDTTVILRNKAV